MTAAGSIPSLPRGVRLHHDRVRGGMVLLAPERALQLDEIGAAILGRVDGRASLAAIAGGLAKEYGADASEVLTDISSFLGDLAESRLVDLVSNDTETKEGGA